MLKELGGGSMSEIEERKRASRLIGGALLLLVGCLFALQNLGILHAGRLGDYWPLLLVWIGLSRMLGPGRSRHFVSGLVVLLLGILLQLDRFGLLRWELRDLWPVLLVIAGASLIFDAFAARRRGES
jgi:hypothetical protein